MREVGGVARDVEAHHVAGQQALDDLLPPRQHREHVRRRERRVVEEVDLHIRLELAQIARREPKVVVVKPHHAVFGHLRRRRLREGPVHLAKRRPVHGVVVIALLEAMQDRPDRLLGGDMVEAFHLRRGQRQARDAIGAVAVLDLDHPLEGRALGRVVHLLPRHPGALAVAAHEAFQRRHDAVGALVLAQGGHAIDEHLLIGLAVIDDDQIRRHCCIPFRNHPGQSAPAPRRCPPRRRRARHGHAGGPRPAPAAQAQTRPPPPPEPRRRTSTDR